jgi:hypothetical protein
MGRRFRNSLARIQQKSLRRNILRFVATFSNCDLIFFSFFDSWSGSRLAKPGWGFNIICKERIPRDGFFVLFNFKPKQKFLILQYNPSPGAYNDEIPHKVALNCNMNTNEKRTQMLLQILRYKTLAKHLIIIKVIQTHFTASCNTWWPKLKPVTNGD